MIRRISLFLVAAAVLIGISSCGGAGSSSVNVFAYVLISQSQLGAVNLLNGDPFGGPVGLTANIRNIAVRPTDGALFGLGTDLRLYAINPENGTCTAVSGTALAVDDWNGGMTFAPNSTTIRFISVNGSNYRISSTTGNLLGTDTTANAAIIGLAVRNTDGTYFGYRSDDTLVSTDDIDSGVFSVVGASGVDSSGSAGLAIDNDLGFTYFVADEGVFSVSLNIGSIALVNGDQGYDDIAVANE